tara:strand:+ start:1740 stop:3797 length:2058 start_codon:yes stop_codon:yes gene_type:complete
MALSSKFARLDEDVLLEFIYHDQSNVDSVKIENDDNGSQLKYLNTVTGNNSKTRMLIHELGSDVVNFDINVANGYVYINNFAARELILKNGLTYKFDLNDASIDNLNGFYINGVAQSQIGGIVTYSPNTDGKYTYSYKDLSVTEFIGGSISVGDRANSLYAKPLQETGNTIKTAPGEGGRYYAVPTSNEGTFALLGNDLSYLDSAEWLGTNSSSLSVVPVGEVQAVWYDTIRLHLRTGYSFSGRGYEGFNFKVKAKRQSGEYGYFTSLVYLNSSSYEVQNPQPFTLADSSFSKYIEIKVPSLVHMNDPAKNEEFATTFFGTGQDNLITSSNYEIELGLIETVKTVDGYDYIEIVDQKTLTLSQEDEFVDIAINLRESTSGDFFEFFGTKDGSTSGFENYINGMIQESGDDISVFYDVEVSEQLGLNYLSTYSTSFVQVANFDNPLIYRPVILNSGVSSNFLLTVAMRIYNETDNTQIVKYASLVYNKPKKYGKRMSKINLNGNYGPTLIYNKLSNTEVNRELNQFINSSKSIVGETKYVSVALDTYGILAGSTNLTLEQTEIATTGEIEYKQKGLTEITLSKVSDNFIKFSIAKPKGDSLEAISLVNAEDIILIIKSGLTEQQVYHDPTFPDIDLGNGEVLFKVTKAIAARFDQTDTNLNAAKFYINLKNGATESMLYFGKVKIV